MQSSKVLHKFLLGLVNMQFLFSVFLNNRLKIYFNDPRKVPLKDFATHEALLLSNKYDSFLEKDLLSVLVLMWLFRKICTCYQDSV